MNFGVKSVILSEKNFNNLPSLKNIWKIKLNHAMEK